MGSVSTSLLWLLSITCFTIVIYFFIFFQNRIDDYDAPYLETGCNLVIPLQGGSISRFVFPASCSNSSVCGEKDFFGNPLECCQNIEGGFCAGVPASKNSRCEKVAELVQWDDEEREDDEMGMQQFSNFSQQCYSSDSSETEPQDRLVCMTCSTSCPEGSEKVVKGVNRRNKVVTSVDDRISNLVSERRK